MDVACRVAIAQIAMRWTTGENTAAILAAMALAKVEGARICAFSELALTGFHREIAREARPDVVLPALAAVCAAAARLRLAVALGAPTFGADGSKFNSHLLIDESGRIAAEIPKAGLTDPEATFFARGIARPIGVLQGLRCSAVICREVADHASIETQLPPRAVDLVFVPGALRQDPEQPRTDPPEFVRDIQRIARQAEAFVLQTNWPNALNRPEESVDGGASVVAGPGGDVRFRLPAREAGVAVFALGESRFGWHGEAAPQADGRHP